DSARPGQGSGKEIGPRVRASRASHPGDRDCTAVRPGIRFGGMRHCLAMALVLAAVAASATPVLSRDPVGRDPTILLGSPAPRTHVLKSRIPAPLPAPAQAPVINGPISQPAFRGLSGIGQ